MWRYVILAPLALLVALSVGAVPAGGGEGVFASVQGKGSLAWEWGGTTDIRIVVTQTSSWQVTGRIEQVDYGHGTTLTEVTCVRPSAVPGSSAVAIGGVVLSGYAPPPEGTLYIVDDLGVGDGAPFDQIGIGSGPTASTCPFDPGLIAPGQLYTLVGGDFKVKTH